MTGTDSQTGNRSDRDSAGDPRGGVASSASQRPPRHRGTRAGIAFFRVAGVGYLALLATLVLVEPRLVYPGVYFENAQQLAQIPGDPAIVDVEYASGDQTVLTGRLLDRPGSENHLLFLHGNASHAVLLDKLCIRLSEVFDATVLIAEYRGFGGVGPTPTEAGVLDDAAAAMRFFCQREGIRPNEVIVYGRSLGGGCAVSVAAEMGARVLVLDRTFDSAVSVASKRFPFVPVRWMMRNRFDSISRIDDFEGPLVQLHGTVDSVVPVEHGRALFAAAGEPKEWIELPQLGHNDRLSSGELATLVSAVNRVLED